MRKVILISGMLAIGLAIAGYMFFSGERKAPVRYKTAPVTRGPLVSTVTATGSINPVTIVQVGSQVSGMIESLHADFNTVVKKGEVVARIDPFPYRARRDQAAANLANAKAAVMKARADLSLRKRELDRAASLSKQQFVSQQELDTAVTAHEGAGAQLAVAEAAVKQAEAALEAAELDLKYTVIRSPIDGIVISRQVEAGQRVASSLQIPTLFLIAQDLMRMQVDANVSEADIGDIAIGKEAVFTVDAYPGEVFHGVVKQVRNAPISVQNVVTYDVVIGVMNKDLRLKPGMTANVSIVVARKDQVLRVPNSALRFVPPRSERPDAAAPPPASGTSGPAGGTRKDQASSARDGNAREANAKVWRIGASGDPEPVPIQRGFSDGNATEVVSGPLAEGDQVIIGIETLRTAHKSDNLPPGFGSGQRPGSRRDRGL
jgi:HlyD family secretion protein